MKTAESFADLVVWQKSHLLLTIFPGVAFALLVLGFNFLGDGLRDALDPQRLTTRS